MPPADALSRRRHADASSWAPGAPAILRPASRTKAGSQRDGRSSIGPTARPACRPAPRQDQQPRGPVSPPAVVTDASRAHPAEPALDGHRRARTASVSAWPTPTAPDGRRGGRPVGPGLRRFSAASSADGTQAHGGSQCLELSRQRACQLSSASNTLTNVVDGLTLNAGQGAQRAGDVEVERGQVRHHLGPQDRWITDFVSAFNDAEPAGHPHPDGKYNADSKNAGVAAGRPVAALSICKAQLRAPAEPAAAARRRPGQPPVGHRPGHARATARWRLNATKLDQRPGRTWAS